MYDTDISLSNIEYRLMRKHFFSLWAINVFNKNCRDGIIFDITKSIVLLYKNNEF